MKLYGIEIPFRYINYIISIFLVASLLTLICGIICSYYVFKWFKINIDNYNFYLNDYNIDCTHILEKYGDFSIKKVYLARRPISKFMKTALNIVTLYKFERELKKYVNKTKNDVFFPYHTSIIVEINLSKRSSKFIIIEKNNCMKLSSNFKISCDHEFIDLKVKKNKYTLKNLLETTRKRIGDDKFFNWEIYKNNCQIIIKEILISLNKFDKKNKEFMYQAGFTNGLEVHDLSLHIIRSLTNSVNFLENFIGKAIWCP